MLYQIEWCEQKPTAAGKEKMVARLKGEDKTLHENVTIWGDFPNYAEIKNGGSIEGDIVPAKDPKFGPSLYPPKPAQTTSSGAPRGSGGAYKAKQIEEHETRKQGFIKDVVNSKEESIKLAGCQRDAVLLTQTLYGQTLANDNVLSEDEKRAIIKKEVIRFRDWLLSSEFTEVLPFSTDGTK